MFEYADSGEECRNNGFRLLVVPAELGTEPELYRAIERALGIEGYGVSGWDALLDVMTDLSWYPGEKKFVLFHQGFPWSEWPLLRQLYLQVLCDAISRWQDWRDEGFDFRIVFPTSARNDVEKALADILS